MLADPVACPGLIEGLAALLAVLLPGFPAGTLVASLNVVCAAAAALAVAGLAWRVTGSRSASVLVGVTAIATLAESRTFALSEAGALAAVALAVAARLGRARPVDWPLALAAAVHPPLTFPAAAAVLVAPRVSLRWTATAIALVVLAGLVAARIVPAPDSSAACVWPPLGGWSAPSLRSNLGVVFGVSMSPVLPALAVAGLVAWRPRAGRTVWASLTAMTGLSLAVAAAPNADAHRTLAPLVVALWALASAGLAGVLAWAPKGRGRLAVLALLAALPVLQWLRPAPPADPADAPLDHATLTLDRLAEAVDALPAGAALVREDALTMVLWRGLPESQRPPLLPRADDDVAEALAAGTRVFAFPRAVRHLELRGVRSHLSPAAGLAEIDSVEPCVVADDRWRPFPAAAGADGLAFVGAGPRSRGPVIGYFASAAPLGVYPRDWPRGIERGFHAAGYDLALEADRIRLEGDLDVDAMQPAWPAGVGFVTRIEVWRVPGAPLALPVAIEGPFSTAVVRAHAASDPNHPPRVCPSYVAPSTPSARFQP